MLEPAASLGVIPAKVPETPERRGQPDLHLRTVGFSGGPLEGGSKIIVLAFEAIEPIIAYPTMFDRGDPDQAAHWYTESLRRSQHGRRGPTWSAAECVEGIAGVAMARGQCERAARLFGAADMFRQTRGYPRRFYESARYAEQIAAVRHVLGDRTFERASAEGSRLTLEEAVDYALTSSEADRAETSRRLGKSAVDDPLTAREREVAALVARGQTNREIAVTLVVSERTADAHVQNSLNKLGFSSRAQIAAWAVERGLHRPATAEASPPDAPPRPPKARHGT